MCSLFSVFTLFYLMSSWLNKRVETDIVLAIVLEAIDRFFIFRFVFGKNNCYWKQTTHFQLLKNEKQSFFKPIIFLETIVFLKNDSFSQKKIANESGFYDN